MLTLLPGAPLTSSLAELTPHVSQVLLHVDIAFLILQMRLATTP